MKTVLQSLQNQQVACMEYNETGLLVFPFFSKAVHLWRLLYYTTDPTT